MLRRFRHAWNYLFGRRRFSPDLSWVRRRLPVWPAVLHGQQRGLGARLDLQFGVNVREVSLNGANAEVKFLRDVFVAESVREQSENIAFALSERFNSIEMGCWNGDCGAEQLRQQRRGDKEFAARDLAQGAQEFFERRGHEHIAHRPRP